nr:MAG TPA: hypothetical protein [Caudoviricetes sp.]
MFGARFKTILCGSQAEMPLRRLRLASNGLLGAELSIPTL